MSYSRHFRNTPQREKIPGREMVQNAAGGYVFEIDDWQRLRRFLILGCEGGTYYESERKLTLENAETIRRCLKEDGARTVDAIVEVSDKGLAPKNDAAIFALAVATKFGDDATRRRAFDSIGKVCRIGTHLFQFAESREAIGGGWGRGMRRGIARCYDRADLSFQALKYAQRNGWSHRDLLRLAHPKCAERASVYDAICHPEKWSQVPEPVVEGYLKLQSNASDVRAAAQIIADYRLPREVVPTELLTHAAIWNALLPPMPAGALVRNLGNMSKVGLLIPFSKATEMVVSKLTDQKVIASSRLHPFAILVGAKTYASGHGSRGRGEWTPVPQIVDALDRSFELAFPNVTPTGKRIVLAVDISSSMRGYGLQQLTPAQCAAAIAVVIARTEPNYHIMGFSDRFIDLGITQHDTLVTALMKTDARNFGSTDTSVAIEWAARGEIPVDVFVVLTDNETWAGDSHTCSALASYRRKTGLLAKLAVVAFTGTQRTIGDTQDLNTMDFVGMDASLPQALSAFMTL